MAENSFVAEVTFNFHIVCQVISFLYAIEFHDYKQSFKGNFMFFLYFQFYSLLFLTLYRNTIANKWTVGN